MASPFLLNSNFRLLGLFYISICIACMSLLQSKGNEMENMK